MKTLSVLLLVLVAVQHMSCEIIVTRKDTSSLERPCTDYDLDCVKSVFAAKGWCSSGTKLDSSLPYYVGTLNIEIPCVNTTLANTNTSVTGLNKGTITEFFINSNTDTALLSLSFLNFTIDGTSNFYYHKNGVEDVTIVSTSTHEEYPQALTTTTSTGSNKFSSGNMVTTSRVYELPEFYFDGIDDLTDTEAINIFTNIAANKGAVTSELLIVKGPSFAEFYINNIICA